MGGIRDACSQRVLGTAKECQREYGVTQEVVISTRSGHMFDLRSIYTLGLELRFTAHVLQFGRMHDLLMELRSLPTNKTKYSQGL